MPVKLENAYLYGDSGTAAGFGFSILDNGAVHIQKCCLSSAQPQYVIFPGFVDVHIHLREPGFFYKEGIRTGTLAAARGGYTAVCAMPNLNPVPDSRENLDKELTAIKDGAVINVYPYGALTVAEKGAVIADLEGIADKVIAFSDDGKGVQRGEMMQEAMLRAKALGKVIAAHCEDESLLLKGGCIHDGVFAKAHNLIGISSASEWKQVERDLDLAAKTGCAYHVCHVSCKESVALIRQAKKSGVNVTCETAPHYLLLDETDLIDEGRYKMNPPLRGREDKEALLEGIKDGTVDMIATDHAPHSAEEKSRGLANSPFGISGLECAFAVLYTGLVQKKIITLDKLLDLMSAAPAKRFGIPLRGFTEGGDYTVFDLTVKDAVDSSSFLSKGKSTPFDGRTVTARCKLTVCGGKAVWIDENN